MAVCNLDVAAFPINIQSLLKSVVSIYQLDIDNVPDVILHAFHVDKLVCNAYIEKSCLLQVILLLSMARIFLPTPDNLLMLVVVYIYI